jgi:REP element-mobilizing transposase RayT
MSRKIPEYLPGHYYHLYNRGASKGSIFRDEDNYVFVLRKIKHYSREYALTVIAYCLMPNHYHLLVRQEGQERAGLLPQRVFNSYTKAYNKRYEHSGTLFQGPYRAIHLESESHLLHLCRYIHANPVKDGLVATPEDWPYSNYLEWIDERPGTLVDRAFVHEHFVTPADYCSFVMGYLRGHCVSEEIERYVVDWDS